MAPVPVTVTDMAPETARPETADTRQGCGRIEADRAAVGDGDRIDAHGGDRGGVVCVERRQIGRRVGQGDGVGIGQADQDRFEIRKLGERQVDGVVGGVDHGDAEQFQVADPDAGQARQVRAGVGERDRVLGGEGDAGGGQDDGLGQGHRSGIVAQVEDIGAEIVEIVDIVGVERGEFGGRQGDRDRVFGRKADVAGGQGLRKSERHGGSIAAHIEDIDAQVLKFVEFLCTEAGEVRAPQGDRDRVVGCKGDAGRDVSLGFGNVDGDGVVGDVDRGDAQRRQRLDVVAVDARDRVAVAGDRHRRGAGDGQAGDVGQRYGHGRVEGDGAAAAAPAAGDGNRIDAHAGDHGRIVGVERRDIGGGRRQGDGVGRAQADAGGVHCGELGEREADRIVGGVEQGDAEILELGEVGVAQRGDFRSGGVDGDRCEGVAER
ncbi:hypothetical protein [Rhizobium sp. G21]|uniref:hypothetical protein n=1 Tax=Rhizobium sp. G21 TaxID=2758439 RepID=UPI0016034753|nr:hypothetical protein [Rhizobium sp. G21]MBB1248345.1 hypothetical protein [Rhizobium sp. G21]